MGSGFDPRMLSHSSCFDLKANRCPASGMRVSAATASVLAAKFPEAMAL
jgi:hypothetical protein